MAAFRVLGAVVEAVGWLALFPMTFVHELGHGLAALRRTHTQVGVDLGRNPHGQGLTLRRMTFRAPMRLKGFCHGRPRTNRDRFWISLGGPIASMIVGASVAFILATLGIPRGLAGLVGLYFAVPGITSLFQYDGREARRAWQHRGEDVLAYDRPWCPPARCVASWMEAGLSDIGRTVTANPRAGRSGSPPRRG